MTSAFLEITRSLYPFLRKCLQYANLNCHSFPVILSSKNCLWKGGCSACNLVTQALFLLPTVMLWFAATVPYECSHFVTWGIKRDVLKGRCLMKLIVFTASSRTFLSDIDFFFSTVNIWQ